MMFLRKGPIDQNVQNVDLINKVTTNCFDLKKKRIVQIFSFSDNLIEVAHSVFFFFFFGKQVLIVFR